MSDNIPSGGLNYDEKLNVKYFPLEEEDQFLLELLTDYKRSIVKTKFKIKLFNMHLSNGHLGGLKLGKAERERLENQIKEEEKALVSFYLALRLIADVTTDNVAKGAE